MSWKATAYVKELRRAPNGELINKTEKLLLFVLADYSHPDRGAAWPSLPTLASDALLSEREARYTLRELERKAVIHTFKPEKSGRGYVPSYIFLDPAACDRGRGDNAKKGANCAPFNESRLAPEGGKISPGRGQEGGTNGTRNKEEPRTSKATVEPKSNTPAGVLRKHVEAWLEIKKKLLAELGPGEWKLWVRPARLLRVMGSTMLIALPPGGAIIAAAQGRLLRLREIAGELGYGIGLTTYPDDWQLAELKRRHGIDLTPKYRRPKCPPA